MKLYSLKEGLKRARKEAGLTQADLAEKMGVHIKTVMNWEQGIAEPPLGTLMELTELYHCDLDYLTGRLDQKTHDLQFIHDQTGLSEQAIQKLQKIAFRDRATWNSQALSAMIEDPSFSYLMDLMSDTSQGDVDPFTVGNAYIHTDLKTVIKSETRAIFRQISDHVREKLETIPSDNRIAYQLAYGLHAEGKLSDEELSEVIEHYDQGDFDFSPKNKKKRIKSEHKSK